MADRVGTRAIPGSNAEAPDDGGREPNVKPARRGVGGPPSLEPGKRMLEPAEGIGMGASSSTRMSRS